MNNPDFFNSEGEWVLEHILGEDEPPVIWLHDGGPGDVYHVTINGYTLNVPFVENTAPEAIHPMEATANAFKDA